MYNVDIIILCHIEQLGLHMSARPDRRARQTTIGFALDRCSAGMSYDTETPLCGNPQLR